MADWRDELTSMGTEFARALDDARAVRVMVFVLLAALGVSLIIGALAEVTRPRVYVVGSRGEPTEVKVG